MESITYLKDIKSTPKKLRLYLNVVKKMSPQEALDYLLYSTSKQSRVYYKALHSAIANATNSLKVSPDVLQFKLFTVEEGRKLRRYRAGARGTARPILKKSSHIKIILVEKQKEAPKGKSSSVEKKGKVKKTETRKVEASVEVKKEAKPAKKEVKEKKVEVTNKE